MTANYQIFTADQSHKVELEKSDVVVVFNPEAYQQLKDILARACNVWPDAPNEIKWFHDIVIHGHPLQDYESQPRFTKREELPPEVNQQLDRPSTKPGVKKVEPFETENKEPGT